VTLDACGVLLPQYRELLDVPRECFEAGYAPDAVRKTADGSFVIYFYPTKSPAVAYVCLELYPGGEAVAAWRAGPGNDARDIAPSGRVDALRWALDALASRAL